METSKDTGTPTQWPMKEAAQKVGVGLPRLYERLRERGLFMRSVEDHRNVPTTKAQEDGLFDLRESGYYHKQFGVWRPCPKVECTYKGLIVLQEIANELAGEKEESASEQPRVPSTDNQHQGKSTVLRDIPDKGNSRHDAKEAPGNSAMRDALAREHIAKCRALIQ